MATTSPVNNRLGSSVNNGRRVPLQGFDTVVYMQDQATGNLIAFGEFTGFQHTIRNATEPYLPLGHRSLNLLDGEFQIGWVAEQGKINVEVLGQVLGYNFIGPTMRIGRSPRFQIIVEYNAYELEIAEGKDSNQAQYINNDVLEDGLLPNTENGGKRAATGRYIFSFCKIDAYTSGAQAGRSVIADRIEGLAEGWSYEPLNPKDATIKTNNLVDAGGDASGAYDGRLATINVPTIGQTAPSWTFGTYGTLSSSNG